LSVLEPLVQAPTRPRLHLAPFCRAAPDLADHGVHRRDDVEVVIDDRV